MSKARISVIILASLGIVMLFLPWVTIDLLIASISYNVFTVFEIGLQSDPMLLGIIALLLFVVAIIAMGLLDRFSKLKFAATSVAVINLVLGIIMVLFIDEALYPLFILDFAGVGLWLYFVVCVAIFILSLIAKKMPQKDTN